MYMIESFPRVLIVNQQSLKKNNATGITLRSLWGAWPLENMIEVYLDEYETHVEYKEGFKSCSLPANLLDKLAHSTSAKKLNSNLKKQDIEKKGGFKSKLRETAVLALDMFRVSVPQHILNEIEAFKPEVIYTLGATISTLDLVYRLSEKFGIPVVIHYMDNWVEKLQWESNLIFPLYRKMLDSKLKKCLMRSTVGLAISPQMASAYSIKFNMPFFSVMNCVDVDTLVRSKRKPGNPIRFVYAGGLHLDRWIPLLQICKAIEETKVNAILKIYTSLENIQLYRDLFPSHTIFHESVDHSKIHGVYQNSDVLVHAESENPLLSGFFKYSISTKIPEYLASGRVVLFYGPISMGLYDFLKSHGAAFVAGNYTELCENIKKISNFDGYDEVLNNAQNLVRSVFDCSVTRRILKDSLISATRFR